MRCIDELSAEELRGKRVLVRAGLDISLSNEGEVVDVLRVRKSVDTLKFLAERGARVIILSHIGRDPKETNEPVAGALKRYLPVVYVPDLLGHAAQGAVAAMQAGEILLLENVRSDLRETANDASLAAELAAYGDLYVNDAFSNSHRAHATMVSLPKLLPHFAGLLVRDEIASLTEALHPPHPALLILGGAKFETKDPIIRTYLDRYDHVCVVGAIANDILKVRGFPVGRSKISEHAPEQAIAEHPHLLAPSDVTVEDEAEQARVKKPEEVAAGDKIVDIGPDSITELAPLIANAKFILWNGPTGLYEDGYTHYTEAIAELIAKSDAKKVIGGGDTIALLMDAGVPEENLGFLSTGGGAMLEFLLSGSLPAIDALA